MMRICVVSDGLPPYCGGAPLRAFRHTQYLQTVEGLRTMLVAWNRSSDRPSHGFLPAYVHPVSLRFQGVGHIQSPTNVAKFLLHIGELAMRLGSLLFKMRHEFDILHVINAAPWFNLVPILFAGALNKAVILEMVLLGADDPLKLSRRGRPERQLFPHRPLKYALFLKANAYVSKAHALSEAYRQAGLPESKLFHIPSAVDTQRFRPPTIQEKKTLRKELGLNDEHVIILFVGEINERKGPHRLLAAFRDIVLQCPKAQLLLVGPSSQRDPSYAEALKDDVVTWGLSNRIQFVGRVVGKVDQYLKAADIFALPSSHEGLSVAILEAMSSGLAIVASDIPEVAHSQIQNGVEGMLVSVGDTAGLAQALMDLIKDPALRITLGQAARGRVLREFTPEVVFGQYIRLYASLLETKRANIDALPSRKPRSHKPGV